MKESDLFRQSKERAQKKNKAPEVTPLSAKDDSSEKTMELKDYWLTVRRSIQEKVTPEEPLAEEGERIKLLHELVSPELANQYKEIIQGFNGKAKEKEGHPHREFIDINDAELSSRIESWITNILNEVHTKTEAGFDEESAEELRAQCWMLFDSISSVMNTKSLEKDITDFYKNESPEEEVVEQEKKKAELITNLQTHYPLDKIEAGILIDLIQSEGAEGEGYSPKILVETISRLWGEYKLGERKGSIAKISLGYLLSKGAESYAPSLFEGMLAQDKFNVSVFLEYFGLGKISEVIDTKTRIELAKVMTEISHQINERITNSLFFQEFEFIHEKSLGEIYATLERGKSSTEQILEGTVSQFVPTLAGIAMSLAFLMKVNPILGSIGLGSLPIMYRIAKKQNERIWPMYEKEKREGEKIATRLGSIKSGFEEVKTSPEVPLIASHVKEQMDTKDTLSLKRFIEESKMSIKQEIPFDISTIVAAGVGGALQEAGMISGGAILSNVIYSNQLNQPIRRLVHLYFNQFSRYIQDIKRMEEILGGYERWDLPEGEKEKDRTPVSQLESFEISIKDLRYKGILRGVSLDVAQGEFLTLTGASGAGKSTLLRNLVGLYKPDGGEIAIGGSNIDGIKKYGEESIYSIMSYCNQSPQIFDGMTFRENLLLWSKEGTDDEKIKKVLKDLHLDTFVDRLDEEVTHLSGGEKVRIGVARTLIKGAKIMLLDEPTASLDSQAATEVRKIIAEVHEKYPDTTIICVSHDDELRNISGRSVDISTLQK